jgi:hypothetical protein
MRKTWNGRALRLRMGPLAIFAVTAVFACATSVALAENDTDNGNDSSASPETTSSSTTTDEQTTSTSDETTPDRPSSDELDDGSGSTTTTAEELNIAAGTNDVTLQATTTGGGQIKCDPEGPKIENPQAGATNYVTITDTVATVTNTFTFVWGTPGNEGQATEGTWSSSAPFTGQIIVKSANDPPIGSENVVYDYSDATTGTLTSPAFNQNNIRQGISHIEICYEGTGVTTTTSTVTTTTTGTTNTTTTSTGTSTTSPTTTGGVAGETGSGGNKGGEAAEEASERNGPAATQATTGDGNLPFTGLHAPLLALIGIGTALAGFGIRRALQDDAV